MDRDARILSYIESYLRGQVSLRVIYGVACEAAISGKSRLAPIVLSMESEGVPEAEAKLRLRLLLPLTSSDLPLPEELTYIGHAAVFYLPKAKLDCPMNGTSVRECVHAFVIGNYGAYTFQSSDIRGFWVPGGNEGESYNETAARALPVVSDDNVRFEVSFKGKDRIANLVLFLSDVCRAAGEDAIYLTMGHKSYIVKKAEAQPARA